MPHTREPLRLTPGPGCVQQARRWVREACLELGLAELVDASELGVSELVTNALLHARPPISVALGGTPVHPRFEVFDGSRVPPLLTPGAEGDAEFTDPDLDEIDLLMTVGRGLGLVAMNSSSWGADITCAGKVVWFVPASEPREGDLDGEVYDVTLATGAIERVPTYLIHLRGLPLAGFRDFRRHYSDLRREVRLLALAHEESYPLARDLSLRFDRFDEHVDNFSALEQVNERLAAGDAFGDLDLVVGQPAVDSAHQMADLLDLADAFCRSQRLLSLARSDAQRHFQQWLLREIGSQAAGAAPQAWERPSGDKGVHAS